MQRIAIRMMDEMKSDALFFAEGQRVPAQVRLVAPSVAP
jgi:hypothetical protein